MTLIKYTNQDHQILDHDDHQSKKNAILYCILPMIDFH